MLEVVASKIDNSEMHVIMSKGSKAMTCGSGSPITNSQSRKQSKQSKCPNPQSTGVQLFGVSISFDDMP